ncbi:hypothetical protein [Flavobacterium sp. K5-23]|uniref:hypothetical protein n=1 Tax=Flavobacterium sp. K5-23 TaxID=2746225 RepID=UPI0020101E89|nr:hypothetical protein [Flavobacterium sp. K5-23]UQD56042.1 hypothetical protein FLAK523_06440 [Flavobacterium sp. K5-23]
MNIKLYKNISNSTAYRASRQENASLILANPDLYPDLLELSLNTEDKNHHKAYWILELVLEDQLYLLINYLDRFCQSHSKSNNNSALRSVSKTYMFATQHLSLTELQEQKIIKSCLDWLIEEDLKVAPKAYSIRALFELGKKHKWIYSDLQRILNDDYMKYSAGYKAIAREILKKIK